MQVFKVYIQGLKPSRLWQMSSLASSCLVWEIKQQLYSWTAIRLALKKPLSLKFKTLDLRCLGELQHAIYYILECRAQCKISLCKDFQEKAWYETKYGCHNNWSTWVIGHPRSLRCGFPQSGRQLGTVRRNAGKVFSPAVKMDLKC